MATKRRRKPTRIATRTRAVITVIALIVLTAVYAWLRAPGVIAVGSDNDEYLLVAKALAQLEAPIIAGVEGTKYPLLYPALLALMTLGRVPLYAGTAALNLVGLAAALAAVAWLSGRAKRGTVVSLAAGFGAAAVLLTSRAVWNDMFSTMPDILLLGVIGCLLVTIDLPESTKRTVLLTVLAVTAVTLKTMALPLLLGGFGIIWLFNRRLQVLIAPLSATAATLAGMLFMRRHPPHTTGYVETFLLIDPDDAAQGSISATGVAERAITQIPDALFDIGQAVVMLPTSRLVATSIALGALIVGVWGAQQLGRTHVLGQFALGGVIAYTVAMALWPYNAPRFGLPLLPIVALGVGWLLHATGTKLRKPAVTVVLALAVTAGLITTSIGGVRDDGDVQRQLFPAQHASLDAIVDWIDTNAPDANLVSFDYRELANRTDGTVHPIGYTSDPSALREQLGDADLLIVMRFYGKRNRQAQVLLDTYPELFTEVFSVSRGTVYEIDGRG